jgi:hypothetical protein
MLILPLMPLYAQLVVEEEGTVAVMTKKEATPVTVSLIGSG